MTKTDIQWKLPAPPKEEGDTWFPVIRVGRHVPFGYKQDPDDKDLLLPIPEELELLEQAKKHLKKYSLREVANWLSAASGRRISHEGLRKRIKLESRREREATNAEFYAKKAEQAARKAQEITKRLGGRNTRKSTSGYKYL